MVVTMVCEPSLKIPLNSTRVMYLVQGTKTTCNKLYHIIKRNSFFKIPNRILTKSEWAQPKAVSVERGQEYGIF